MLQYYVLLALQQNLHCAILFSHRVVTSLWTACDLSAVMLVVRRFLWQLLLKKQNT